MKIVGHPTTLYIAIFFALSGTYTSVTFAAEKIENNNSSEAIYNFNIAATSLETALALFTKQSSIQFIAPSKLTLNKKSLGLQGRYTAKQALSYILQGTGVKAKLINESTYSLTASDTEQRVLDVVRVEGSNLGGINSADLSSLTGANGSRDLTATEGNKSYAQGNVTVGGNRPVAAQKVTQAVTIVGQQELQDKKAISLADALQSATGVFSAGPNNAIKNSKFYTRGQPIDSFKTDGVSSNNISPNSFGSEMALYDHVEVLRGGDAFTGSSNSANPSASINLVRKKPLEHHQTTFEASTGSWDHYRQVLDTTGPLNLERTLRGRFILSNDLNKNFWNNGDASKQVINGQVEYEISPKTTLNIGVSGAYAKSKPWSASSINTDDSFEFSRAFSTVFRGNKEETKSAGINFSLDHQFNNKWSIKLQGNKDWNAVNSNNMTSYVNHVNSYSPREQYTNNYFIYYPYRETSSDSNEGLVASILGSIDIGGLNQGIEFASIYTGSRSRSLLQMSKKHDRYNFDDFRNVDFASISSLSNLSTKTYRAGHFKTYFAYLKLDLQPYTGLHILTGPRWTRMEPGDIQKGANKTEDNINIPSLGIRYDLNNNISIYGSYNNLFQYVNGFLTRNSKPLDPIEGNSQEVGIKFKNSDQNLTATLALFNSKYKNSVRPEKEDIDLFDHTGVIYYENERTQEINKGIDFSIEGQVTPYWQTSIGYAYAKKESKTLREKDKLKEDGIPWHVKFSNQFKLSGNDILNRIIFGSSTTFVSKRDEQSFKEHFNEETDKVERTIVNSKIKSYAITDLFARYQINDNWGIQFNINNIFDKKYSYSSFPINENSNFYGTPINYLLTVDAKF
ncbi:MAG: Ferric-pseudobactin BN7/BN8 receptor [Acinetobacter bereziniae]|uniref:Ferric-pseudobactin BN7/BN8 receptor n=1 Tax=Acinetobacter bereziniae TaxID=106648 RepID=A0A833TY41_ACIBZ|nr:MAG: Ferric-pseudobactin BN7/BN8 receptor [Acinetobacter bereziniae]